MLVQEQFAARLLNSNLRIDGRQPLQYRKRKALFLPTRGSLVLEQGNSIVSVRVKAQIVAPRNERPAQGMVQFRLDAQACLGSHQQQKKLSGEGVKLLQSAIVGSKALDPQSLCIVSGRYVWRVMVDCSVIRDDGNILDCMMSSVILALSDYRKPITNFENNKLSIKEQVQQPLSLAHLPLPFTFALTQNNLVLDPVAAEERAVLSSITVCLNIYKEICGIHKPGGLGISEQTLSGCVRAAQLQVKQLTLWIREQCQQRPLFTGLCE